MSDIDPLFTADDDRHPFTRWMEYVGLQGLKHQQHDLLRFMRSKPNEGDVISWQHTRRGGRFVWTPPRSS